MKPIGWWLVFWMVVSFAAGWVSHRITGRVDYSVSYEGLVGARPGDSVTISPSESTTIYRYGIPGEYVYSIHLSGPRHHSRPSQYSFSRRDER